MSNGIKQRIKAIEERVRQESLRVFVIIDGEECEVSVNDYLNNRFVWEFEKVVGVSVAPAVFILLKLTDDAITNAIKGGASRKSTTVQALEKERNLYLSYFERAEAF